MAVKQFTSEILTSSDTNTYLANSGLVYVASATLSAAATINVDSVFTSTYTNYRVIVWAVKTTASTDINLKLRAGGTNNSANYYSTSIFASAGSLLTTSENNQSNFRFIYTGSANDYPTATFDIFRPQETVGTSIILAGMGWDGTNVTNRSYNGFHDNAGSFDGFSLSVASGTVTAKYAVYGYRKP
jgi:hypothetical protein